MKRTFIFAGLWLLAATTAVAGPNAPSKGAQRVQVMVVGVFHMANPGLDGHNVDVDDVLAPKRQTEIAGVVNALARFKPTKVAAEWPGQIAAERYASYLKGELPPSRNEVVQLGFRLAKQSGHAAFYGIDAAGKFPYGPIVEYATAHGQTGITESVDASFARQTVEVDRRVKSSSVATALRYLNDPARIAAEHGFYRTTLRVGGGTEQPGAELLTAWYRRNALICANLIQLSQPGDRIAVFYGSGHAFLLRQCASETPGFELVEANAFIPKR